MIVCILGVGYYPAYVEFVRRFGSQHQTYTS